MVKTKGLFSQILENRVGRGMGTIQINNDALNKHAAWLIDYITIKFVIVRR